MQKDSPANACTAGATWLAHAAAITVLWAGIFVHGQNSPGQYDRHLSPAEALDAFETEPGFTVELVAAEPLTIDPVALAFDERGRLFVAENRDYPTGSPDGTPLGVIALLEDRDGDGRMDQRTEFASGIQFPNGVMAWRGGVIVTAAPAVWWFADLDGDGHAEVKQLLLTGFDTDSTSQLRANDPTLGPDGWIYIAGGLRGGKVHSPKRPDIVLDLAKGDLRFQPDTGEMELTQGKSQFGLAFDDAGNRFACMNRVQVQHAPLPARYLARNPHLNAPGVLHNCPDITDNTLMTRHTGGAARYYPISANITTADSHVGTYSAACAVHIYRGKELPPAYWGAAFSCDPTGNLVRGDRLEKVGGTFTALRIHEGTEALRSRDNWFRPVFIADGSDGALYIADMYRKVIEHPEYLPEEVRKHTDFAAGNDKGRIWRLSGAKKEPSAPTLKKFPGGSLTQLVSALSSEIPWERDTAFRLLVEQRNSDALPLLKKVFQNSRDENAAVLQFHLLRMFEAVDEKILEGALQHPQAGVRRNALRFSDSLLKSSAKLRELALRCVEDPDPHVRFQAALSLGEIDGPEVIPALARVGRKQSDDPWTRAAIQSSLNERGSFLVLLREVVREEASEPGLLTLVDELGRQVGLRSGKANAAEALKAMRASLRNANMDFQIAALAGFLEAAQAVFSSAEFKEVLAAAREACANDGAPAALRVQSTRLLARDDLPETRNTLMKRLVPSEPDDVQIAAARALLRPGEPQLAAQLITKETWARYTPALRMVLLNLLTSREEFAAVLLDAIESGAVPAGVLTPGNRNALRKSKNERVRNRAQKLLAAVGGDRQQAFEKAKAALNLLPHPANGRTIFHTHCAACHRLNQEGVPVGPDLFGIRNQPKESILYHIIVPEAEVAPNFVTYECETTDGRTLSGLLASESAVSITLRMAQGLEEIIPRAQIKKLTASALSLMPQEFEKTMTQQELADLLAYLRGEQ